MLEETAALHPAKPALHQPLGAGEYRTYTWAEFRDRVQWTAVGLSTIGVESATWSHSNRKPAPNSISPT